MAEVLSAPSPSVKLDPVLRARIGMGFGQGLVLAALVTVLEGGAWPAGMRLIAVPLALIVLCVPLVLIQGWTGIARFTLSRWAAAVTALGAVLGLYDAWRRAAAAPVFPRDAWPSPQLMIGFVFILFVGQALVAAAASEGKVPARYSTLFDVVTKQVVQMAAGVAFVGALWASLLLGGQLFRLIQIAAFTKLLGQSWFGFPASMLALALAVHVTDVNPGLVRGLRSLALTLLSWLLPVMTVIVAAFVASLPFTGLHALWATKFAASLLLAIAASLILLINAAYQDGSRSPPWPMRVVIRIASALLVPIVAIAAYALALRVGQYGWTIDRILALAVLIVAGYMALSYGVAAVTPGIGLQRIEICNLFAACLGVLVLLSLLTPVLDPARIAARSQVARLHAGKIPADQFDYAYLRSQGSRFSAEAFEALKADPSAAVRAFAAHAERAPRTHRPGPFF